MLVLWSTSPEKSSLARTRATMPVAALSVTVATASFCLSWFEYPRSIRPSPLLDVYLLSSVVVDIARARTLWLSSPHSTITSLFTSSIVVRIILATLESFAQPVKASRATLSKEEISGSYSRSVFFWLSSLFIDGYTNILSLQDLYPLDAGLKTKKLYGRLQNIWENGR